MPLSSVLLIWITSRGQVSTTGGPESPKAFEVYCTKGSLNWNLVTLNELHFYQLTVDPNSGNTMIYVGGFPFHGAFVPSQANAIGFEDLVAIEDFNFLQALATATLISSGFAEAVDVVSIQQAVIDSWESRTWGEISDLRRA